jgi:bifunctional non-homologous end joining protein LigD
MDKHYSEKRNFERTPEPKPTEGASYDQGAIFVVHRHEARRLHHDLRISCEGALSSWAIPKGFSYNPKDKRLAVRTEDHPLEYKRFEGVIPSGEYGAGTITLWDTGAYSLVIEEKSPFNQGFIHKSLC